MSKLSESKEKSTIQLKQEEASLLQTRLVIMKKMYEKTVSNLKQENDYLKQLLVDFMPDTEYYKKICNFLYYLITFVAFMLIYNRLAFMNRQKT
jgi:hypothetical protein